MIFFSELFATTKKFLMENHNNTTCGKGRGSGECVSETRTPCINKVAEDTILVSRVWHTASGSEEENSHGFPNIKKGFELRIHKSRLTLIRKKI